MYRGGQAASLHHILLLLTLLLQLLPAYPAAAVGEDEMRKGHCTYEGHNIDSHRELGLYVRNSSI